MEKEALDLFIEFYKNGQISQKDIQVITELFGCKGKSMTLSQILEELDKALEESGEDKMRKEMRVWRKEIEMIRK